MKFNDKDLIDVLEKKKSDLEGKLHHRGPNNGTFRSEGFRERFFKLVGNLLFYYRISELSQIEEEPMGVVVLENYKVRVSQTPTLPFAFEIIFNDEQDKRHIFTTRTEKDLEIWVQTLKNSSYQHWKEQYEKLKKKIQIQSTKTGSGSLASIAPAISNNYDNRRIPQVHSYNKPQSSASALKGKDEDLIKF